MQSNTQPTLDSPFQWQPHRWLLAACRLLEQILVWLAVLVAVVVCMVLMHHVHPQFGFVGLVLTPLLGFPVLVIHEVGHMLGARATGMTVAYVGLGQWEWQALRRGWRMRRRKGKAKLRVQGYVIAHPNPYRPMRRQWLVMTLGGPVANLVAAAVTGGALLWVEASAVRWLLAGLAGLNLITGISNLLPSENDGDTSDGLQLLRWLRVRDEQTPELIAARFDGLGVKGATAGEFPSESLVALETLPHPMPLLHLWWRLKADQAEARWEEAAGWAPALDERLSRATEDEQHAIASWITILRCELRFARVMAGQPVDHAIDAGLDAEADWHSPCLRPRCLALEAARKGDDALARQHLDEARKLADQSIDLALHRIEAALRAGVLDFIENGRARNDESIAAVV